MNLQPLWKSLINASSNHLSWIISDRSHVKIFCLINEIFAETNERNRWLVLYLRFFVSFIMTASLGPSPKRISLDWKKDAADLSLENMSSLVSALPWSLMIIKQDFRYLIWSWNGWMRSSWIELISKSRKLSYVKSSYMCWTDFDNCWCSIYFTLHCSSQFRFVADWRRQEERWVMITNERERWLGSDIKPNIHCSVYSSYINQSSSWWYAMMIRDECHLPVSALWSLGM